MVRRLNIFMANVHSGLSVSAKNGRLLGTFGKFDSWYFVNDFLKKHFVGLSHVVQRVRHRNWPAHLCVSPGEEMKNNPRKTDVQKTKGLKRVFCVSAGSMILLRSSVVPNLVSIGQQDFSRQAPENRPFPLRPNGRYLNNYTADRWRAAKQRDVTKMSPLLVRLLWLLFGANIFKGRVWKT